MILIRVVFLHRLHLYSTHEYSTGMMERGYSQAALYCTLHIYVPYVPIHPLLEVSVHNVYITNQYRTTFAQGGGGSKFR